MLVNWQIHLQILGADTSAVSCNCKATWVSKCQKRETWNNINQWGKTLCTFRKQFVNRVLSKRIIVKVVNLAIYNLDITDRGFFLRIWKIQSFFESASKTLSIKMAGESVSKRKLIFLIFFLTYCGQCHMYPSDLQGLNIDQISQKISNNPKIMNILLNNDSYSAIDNLIHPKYDIIECANELNSIKESLQKFELWPIKRNFALTLTFTSYIFFLHKTNFRKYFLFSESVLDSWGKMPSGILSGNRYDFGDFRRCFHLDRNGGTYPTQYCLGRIVVDLNAFITPDYLRRNADLQSFVSLIENGKKSNPMKSMLNL